MTKGILQSLEQSLRIFYSPKYCLKTWKELKQYTKKYLLNTKEGRRTKGTKKDRHEKKIE